MVEKAKCPLCDSECETQRDYDTYRVFYACPVCGRYQLNYSFFNNPKATIDYNHFASYLCHHRFASNMFEYRYHTTLDKETCDKYREDFDNGNNTHGRPVHIDQDIIENWYPKTFAERVDYILLFLNANIKHIGQRIPLSYQEAISAFFVDRKETDSVYSQNWKPRKRDDCEDELKYMLECLQKKIYIEYTEGSSEDEWIDIALTPEGYARVDVLQKNTLHGKNALVAMKFGDDTKVLREAIRKGISGAGYIAIFIDEVQHNDFITPELLKHIRDSKFVVCDLTHQNNGAYFEEGYAMGLGKPVIQLCKEDTKLHFDIAQKNTIIWSSEDEIIERLTNRIKATID